jgi:hypothetical protein
MTKPKMDGKFVLLDVEPDSKLDLSVSDRPIRIQEVSGHVKQIAFKGQVEQAHGTFSENIGITLSWTIARDCYVAGIMPATIQFASTAVECAINNDSKMRSAREKQYADAVKSSRQEPNDWLQLSNSMLRKAQAQGLSVQILMDGGESLNGKTIAFIYRRNKIAHGDYSEFTYHFQSNFGTDVPVTRKFADIYPRDALDQFVKCSNFLKVWIGQNPDIQGFFG